MPPIPFEHKLILNRWVLSILEVSSFEKLQEWLKDPSLEGFDEENISRYANLLTSRLFDREFLTEDDLLRYDANIVRYWQQITEDRNHQEGRILNPKYFQYLALLFTEIYLDRYFLDSQSLLADLNRQVTQFNVDQTEREQVQAFEETELNKLAFWMATGSGKTLLMHCNLLQYQHYLDRSDRRGELNRVILLTPNEGLSQQHLLEFNQSGIQATIFNKQQLGSFFRGREVEIIDIHKLSDEMGDKTVDVAAFEGNNLVLVDEGHAGASSGQSGQWMRRREALCEDGFSFEYSATFKQAIKNNSVLTQTYAKSILFDYSYRYFYYDGYGKEYRILNLENDDVEDQRVRYLVACLLTFYQQLKINSEKQLLCREYMLEKPLWVFVGGRVNAVRTQNRRKVSDVVDILLFLADFTNPDNKSQTISLLNDILNGRAGLLNDQGRDIFETAFSFLVSEGMTGEQAYQEILDIIFNAPAPAKLHVEDLKGVDGEIALRIGDNDYFGVINVGDTRELVKLCELQDELFVDEQPISESLFHKLDQDDSSINILIGSRKFMQGWNSWRVSIMGLMNIGRNEGTQIIQLFGRGVRLKGKEYSLMRSNMLPGDSSPREARLMETLNVFGVRADYMRQFREFLEDEGLRTEDEKVEFIMPVVKNLGTKKLKIVRLREGVDFKKDGPRPILDRPDELLKRKPIKLNWYPRIQAISTVDVGEDSDQSLNRGYLTDKHIAFLDIQTVYFELQRLKNERAWYNLNLSLEKIRELLQTHDWYELYIPEEQLEFTSFNRVRLWQDIAISLLKKYCDTYYKHKKSEWENEFLELKEIQDDDPNFFSEYQILIEQSQNDILQRLENIKALVLKREFLPIEYRQLTAIMFSQHLYQPLLSWTGGKDLVEIKPVALNAGERDFVKDIKRYFEQNEAYFLDKEMYLLRNKSKGGGIGFFEAGNFYPDFILWIVSDNRQYVNFIDPKGIGRVGIEDPKIIFYQTIKELEKRLADPDVVLNSFIVSVSPFNQLPLQVRNMEISDWNQRNVLFREDDRHEYLEQLFNLIH
ncbi:DEAD/DEAH box helicase family protein [Chloroflexota bacterium]